MVAGGAGRAVCHRRDAVLKPVPTTIVHVHAGFPPEALIMAIVNRISEQEYRELALNESDRLWELWDGVPWEKPLMSMKHEDVASYLGAALIT